MTARRSRSARSAALLALVLTACSTPLAPSRSRHPLETPPASEDLVGRLGFRDAHAEDTLVDLGPELGVGYTELVAANPGVDPWLPGEGTRLVVPNARLLPSGPREGIVVNLGDLRLYYFERGAPPRSYPIGIAKDGYATPLGETKIVAKREKPSWVPGESARRDDPSLAREIKPGPDNPLGEYALYLGWPTYLIHGTNDPRGVGRHSSRGCIRLYPDDVAELYARVAIGTRVRVVEEPVKVGWIGGDLYLEVNPDAEQSLQLDQTAKVGEPHAPRDWRERVERAVGARKVSVDWPRAERAALRRSGVPTRITGGPPTPGELRPPPLSASSR
jgi:L,D-transpeptidase ErfK/SrfK